jgi:2-succinyl-5-enolpyruvyl-6-hydroxy-3-cyclohexene-1-carboxylate synthase
MKLRSLFLLLALALSGLPAQANDLSAPYAPTRAEWLQVALYSHITQTTELWKRRVGVVVAVFPQERQVTVVISSANESPEPTQAERDAYVRHIQEMVGGFLAHHEWAKNLRVTVHFQ